MTEDEYKAALAEFERFFDDEPAPGTVEAARFEALSMMLGAYESEHFPIAPPSLSEALRFRMEHSGLTQTDLANVLGSRSRASEVLAGKRGLSKRQIMAVHVCWGIPLECLMLKQIA